MKRKEYIIKYTESTWDSVTITVWEPSEIFGPHGTITFINGKCYGKVGTKHREEWYDHLLVGEERFKAVDRAYGFEKERAFMIAKDAYPNLPEHAKIEDGGDIIISNLPKG